MIMNIIWDPVKAAANRKKHGVEFSAAATVLDDPMALTIEDESHHEQRFVTAGVDFSGRVLVVVYTYADADTIRLISARKATPRERKAYEEGI